MLTLLAIRDFAIIDRLEVELEPGLVVITGETGAGKSILINALHLLLGGRASHDLIRDGADAAEVQAVFELAPDAALLERLREQGLEDGGALRIRRLIHRTGRNRVFINDRAVSLGRLAELAGGLVDISGQHEHVGLTDEDSHLDVLDAFGRLGAERARTAAAVEAWRAAERELAALRRAERQRAEREDYLRFALARIDEVAPEPGEDERLEAERLRLANAERLATGLGNAVGWLYEAEGSAVEQIGRAVKELEGLQRFDPGLAGPLGPLTEGLRAVEDSAGELRDQAAGLQADPARLDRIEQRLQALRGLMRSHGPGLQAVLERRAELAAELDELQRIDSRRAELAAERDQALAAALERAAALSAERSRAAERLAERLRVELAALAMPEARFEVEIRPGGREALGEHGFDRVRFLFNANPGEGLRPLAKVASGGELSRLLLAIKAVLAETDPVAVYVFDEVDAGVGGAVAEVIGDKLAAVARAHQVLCITHLPQIAAAGTAHYTVHKTVSGGRTVSGIDRLGGTAQRTEELARMLAGRRVTARARAHARELLERAAAPG
jgi:DNA repair protein RecN (Recombination protein N)